MPRRTPAANSIENAMQPTTIVVPRSGCFKMRTAAIARKNNSGRTTACQWSGRLARLASRSAANTTMASFINSEGWTWIGPTPTHRVEPPEKCPMPGMNTTTRSEKATNGSRKRSLRMNAIGVRLAATAALTPITM